MFTRTVAALVVLSALSCRRPLPAASQDAGWDGGAASVGETRPGDVPVVDAPASSERAGDVTGDVSDAGPADAGAAICPAGVPPLDVCGCGCCGEAMGRACYYPSLGETRDAIPNPIPPPTNCAMAGCSFGVRHLCCADPGAQPGAGIVCARDTSEEDLARFTITRRIGDACITLELGSAGPRLPVVGPPGYKGTDGWRAPCDGSTARVAAIGGLGTVTPGTSGTLLPFPRYDVHVVLFFDDGSGVAEAVRIDMDDVAVAPRCDGTSCATCGGACAFDATYSYGYDPGRNASFRHIVQLTPPASFMHVREPVLTMPASFYCTPAIPACGGDALDVADVMAALADADVQHAFELTTGDELSDLFYGIDPRPGGGLAFTIRRGDGAEFSVGAPCPPGSDTSCNEIPIGIRRMITVLTAFDQQQLADVACATLRP